MARPVRSVEIAVPEVLVLAAEDVLDRALLEFLARQEGEISGVLLFAAFIQGARNIAERTKIGLVDHLLGAPSKVSEPERAAIAAQVAAEYEATRRLVRDEP